MKALLTLVLFLSILGVAHADDLKLWFDSLKNRGGGGCCSYSDGISLRDVDWEIAGGHYKVRIGGEWIIVPDEAVVVVPNRIGTAVVWPIMPGEGVPTTIRCFMPGALT